MDDEVIGMCPRCGRNMAICGGRCGPGVPEKTLEERVKDLEEFAKRDAPGIWDRVKKGEREPTMEELRDKYGDVIEALSKPEEVE